MEFILASGDYPDIEAAFLANLVQARTDLGVSLLTLAPGLDYVMGAYMTMGTDTITQVENRVWPLGVSYGSH